MSYCLTISNIKISSFCTLFFYTKYLFLHLIMNKTKILVETLYIIFDSVLLYFTFIMFFSFRCNAFISKKNKTKPGYSDHSYPSGCLHFQNSECVPDFQTNQFYWFQIVHNMTLVLWRHLMNCTLFYQTFPNYFSLLLFQ